MLQQHLIFKSLKAKNGWCASTLYLSPSSFSIKEMQKSSKDQCCAQQSQSSEMQNEKMQPSPMFHTSSSYHPPCTQPKKWRKGQQFQIKGLKDTLGYLHWSLATAVKSILLCSNCTLCFILGLVITDTMNNNQQLLDLDMSRVHGMLDLSSCLDEWNSSVWPALYCFPFKLNTFPLIHWPVFTESRSPINIMSPF